MRPVRQLLKFGADKGGAALLELSLALPVVMALGLGAVEYGNMIYGQHLIENGVRDAARFGAGLPQTDLAGVSLVAANDTKMKNMAVFGTVTSGGAPRLSWWTNTATVAVSYTTVNNNNGSGGKLYRGGPTITMVTVTADVPYPGLAFLSFLGTTAPTLHASHQERVYGIR